MPSAAAHKSTIGFERANVLRAAALRLRPRQRAARGQIYYHAALALSVATWDAYLNDIVIEFFGAVANLQHSQFQAMAAVSRNFAELAAKRFNTPNFENSRELLVNCTGYDPYSDWAWPQRAMSVLQVKERLNQILKVRHSFAHGFAIPTYPWTQSPAGRVRLTSDAVSDTIALLRHLIASTDRGLNGHIATMYQSQFQSVP
jgi:hypothetical protein